MPRARLQGRVWDTPPSPAALRALLALVLLTAGSVAASVAASVVVSGCGYSTTRLTDFPGARTIAIVPFENTGFYRDIELELTARVVQEVRARSSLGMGTVDSADLILRGSMGNWETPVVLGEEGRIIQKRLEGWLDITVTDRVSGRIVRAARVRATADFRPGPEEVRLTGIEGESLRGSATQIWTRRLAEQIAQQLEKPL